MRFLAKTMTIIAICFLFGCSDSEPIHDVTWYREHPKERKLKIEECRNGTREKRLTSNCNSAGRAEYDETFSPKNDAMPSINSN